MTVSTTQNKPWYREPWPWILMGGPFVVVVAAVATAWLAFSTADSLVEDDYYKKGLAIDQTLKRDQAAKALHLEAQFLVGQDPSLVRLMLQGDNSAAFPASLRLKVVHPTLAGMDQTIVLTHSGGGLYEGRLARVSVTNKWRLILEDTAKSWRLTGIWHVAKDRSVPLHSEG